MKAQDKNSLDEKVLSQLSTRSLRKLRKKGLQMEKEIATRQEELKQLLVEGFTEDGLVSAKVNGSHQVIDVSIKPEMIDWQNDQAKTCAKITEAINDAIYKIDLITETEISTIQYNYIREVIESEFPETHS